MRWRPVRGKRRPGCYSAPITHLFVEPGFRRGCLGVEKICRDDDVPGVAHKMHHTRGPLRCHWQVQDTPGEGEQWHASSVAGHLHAQSGGGGGGNACMSGRIRGVPAAAACRGLRSSRALPAYFGLRAPRVLAAWRGAEALLLERQHRQHEAWPPRRCRGGRRRCRDIG